MVPHCVRPEWHQVSPHMCRCVPSACLVVPATYNASYRDEPEEAKQTSVVADLSNPLDIADDDDSVVGPPGEFTASINCTFPSMEPSADIEAKRDAGECTLTLVLSIAPNGVDFVGACQIPAFCT